MAWTSYTALVEAAVTSTQTLFALPAGAGCRLVAADVEHDHDGEHPADGDDDHEGHEHAEKHDHDEQTKWSISIV